MPGLIVNNGLQQYGVGKLTLETQMETQTQMRDARYAATESIPDDDEQPLRECLARHLRAYFDQLDGELSGTLYKLVIAEIEPPLFEHVLDYTRGNVSRAAEMLGIHRSTLRRKLISYGLL